MRIAYLLNNKDNSTAIDEKALQFVKTIYANKEDVDFLYIKRANVKKNFDFQNIRCFNYSGKISYFLIYIRIIAYVIKKKYDIIYSRSLLYMPGLFILQRIVNIVYEINANEVQEYKILKKKNIYHFIKYYYKIITREILYHQAKGFIAVTNEIATTLERFHKPVFVVPNSIDTNKFLDYRKVGSKKDIPVLFFIGSPSNLWHGVDKILHLAKLAEGRLFINIVGMNNPADEVYKNIKFHGYLSNDNWLEIAKSSDIAISSLALHREGISEACPFKSRYYLACGLPVIAAYSDVALKGKKFSFIYELDNTEDNIAKCIDSIINFCYREQATVIPMEQIKEYIDIGIHEQKRYTHLLELNQM